MKLTEDEALRIKNEYQLNFKIYCKDKNNSKNEIDKYAKELWLSYEKYSSYVANLYKEQHVKEKVRYLSSNNLGLSYHRTMFGIPKLKLHKPANMINVMIILILSISSIILFMIDTTNRSLVTVASFLSFSTILYIIVERFRITQHSINEPYNIVTQAKEAVRLMNIYDKNAKRIIFYKNGNVKKNKYKNEVTSQYKFYVINNMDNPYKVSTNAYPLNYKSFRTSGGIYAWVHNNNIVYIGLTNNFSKRMRQHYHGFTKEGVSVKKYTSNINRNNISIKILAETDDKIEQRVLESFYYHKFNPGLNSCEPTKFDRILNIPKYRVVWDKIKNMVSE